MKQFFYPLAFLSLLLFNAVTFSLKAQTAASYVYSYTTPTYAPITGTALVSGVSSFDDDVYTNVPIGFTFYFEGQPYTTVGVSSNGFIWFGSGTASTTEYNPISDATLGTGTITGVIAAYATNLIAFGSTLTDAPTGAPEISYTTTGSACAQTFTVQWKGTYAAADPGSEGFGDMERIDLQIILHQGTNEIAILPHVNPYPYVGSSSGQVGIRGVSNTDFSSLQAPPWNGTADQTTNNAATGTLDPNYPATKSSFNFTPPSCSYTASTGSTDPGCGNNGTVTVTVTGAGTFTYILDNGTTTDTNSTGAFTGLGPGTYTAIVSNGSCTVTSCETLTSGSSTATASNSGPVCSGGTLTLSTPTVSGATYSWTGPNGFISNQQDPVINNVSAANAGTYTVVDTVGGCATGPGTTVVVVNSASAPGVSSNSPLCAGATLTLTDSVSGAKYAWTGPNGFISTLQNPSITNVLVADSGTYTVVDTVGGCVSLAATVHVTVTTVAAPSISSNSPICAGAALNLSDATSGTSYNWTGPNGFTSASQNPSINNALVTDSGTYTLVVTTGGCTSSPATTQVIINPSPTTPLAGNNGPLCTGDTLKLTASGSNGSSYSWTGPMTFNTQNPTLTNINLTDSGVYTVVASLGSCQSAPATTDVTISAPPAAPVATNNSPVCEGSALQLNASTITGATYQWTGPTDFSVQNPNIPVTTLADSGTYTVVASIGSCSSPPATTHVVINPSPAAPVATNNGPLCLGDTLKLTATTVAGATYSWTGPNNFNTQNPVVVNITQGDSGTYTVIATAGGCNSAPASTTVIVNPAPAAPTAGNTGPACTGGSVQLTASNIAGAVYTWTGPQSFNVRNPTLNNVTTADSGTYTVFVTVNGCNSAGSSTTLIVIPALAAPAVGNNGPLCAGDTLQLTANSVNGASYSWTGPANFNVQNPVVPDASAADSGTYSVVASISGCNSPAATTTVIIHAAPATPGVSNNSPVCPGATVNLMATDVSGVTYSWTGPNNYTSQNPSISNAGYADTGVYTLIVNNGNCSSAPVTTTVSLFPQPQAPLVTISDSIVCESDSATVCVQGTWSSYSWSNAANTACFTTTDVGNYYLTVTDANGCTVQSANSVNLSNYAATPVTVSVSGDTLTASSAVAYQWYLNGQAISGATGQTYVATQSGNYMVQITDNHGCRSNSSSTHVSVTGISSPGLGESIHIYPNPSSDGTWQIDIGANLTGSRVVLFDASGKTIYSGELDNIHTAIKADIAPGIYMIQISSGAINYVAKLVKL